MVQNAYSSLLYPSSFSQDVKLQLPYQTQRTVCTDNELWQHVGTKVKYQWLTFIPTSVPTFVVPPAPLFIVRDGLGEEPYPCNEVDPASPTDEDMAKCELVCKTVSFRKVVESIQFLLALACNTLSCHEWT